MQLFAQRFTAGTFPSQMLVNSEAVSTSQKKLSRVVTENVGVFLPKPCWSDLKKTICDPHQ